MKTITKTLPTGITTVQKKSKNGTITITIADEKSVPKLKWYQKLMIYPLLLLINLALPFVIYNQFATLDMFEFLILSPIFGFVVSLYCIVLIQSYQIVARNKNNS